MRRQHLTQLIGTLVVATAMIGLPATAFAQKISGSAHDFSGAAWNTSAGEICNACHTPHNAQAITDAPLWDHTLTTATFVLYSTTTLDATPGQPGGVSKLCLSCHDGTVALDAFGGAAGGTTITGSALFGTDLSNDHPISFTYDDTLAGTDGGLNTPSDTSSGLGGFIAGDMLFSDNMECASCHDPHNAGQDSLLIMSNAASALCLTCHDK